MAVDTTFSEWTPQTRDAIASDVDELLDLIHGLATFERLPEAITIDADDLHRALFSDDAPLHAIVIDDRQEPSKLAGAALWFPKYSTWNGRFSLFLDNIFVRAEHRNHGYGTLLMRELAAICLRADYCRMEWWVLDWNERATAFYSQHGSVPMDEWTVHRLSGSALVRLATPAD